jgi:hypothetical protein
MAWMIWLRARFIDTKASGRPRSPVRGSGSEPLVTPPFSVVRP